MSKVNVSIVNSYTLKLEGDAKKGDLIDLREINKVDTSLILDKIKSNTDLVYLEELNKLKITLLNEHKLSLSEEKLKYETEITKLNLKLEQIETKLKQDLEIKYLNDINNLKALVEQTKTNKDLEYLTKLNHKDLEITNLNNRLNNEIDKIKLENEKNLLVLTEVHNEERRVFEEEISNLKRARTSLSVKNIGEDLETWCDNEYHNQAIAGLDNVSWEKDNEVVGGTKADFIYKVYADNTKSDGVLLTSAILEMKSEDPNSTNTQDINRILKKLDSDRNKKNIEYAILVSELGQTTSNTLLIKKVLEYEKMYIVRPEYFLTVLNIITSFGMKYKELLVQKELERIKFKDFEDILTEFETMKAEILTNSVKHINTQLETIIRQSDNIKSANEKILEAAELIINRHLKTVINKIEDFRINRVVNSIKEI